MEIAWREVRTVRQMFQYIPLEFFQKHSGDVRGMGPCVDVEQAHATWQHSPPFVLNGSSKPHQGVTIRSSINCCTRTHEVNQENAFPVPENGRHDFFHWNSSFEFFWFCSAGMCMMPLLWLLLGFRSVVKNPCFISSHNGVQKLISFLCAAHEKLQHGTHTFRFLVVLTFWAPVCTQFSVP